MMAPEFISDLGVEFDAIFDGQPVLLLVGAT